MNRKRTNSRRGGLGRGLVAARGLAPLVALGLVALAGPAFAEASSAPESATESAPPAAVSSGPKLLEITTIEGQILFPKVLFISSEDPARYRETFHRTYLGTARDLGRTACLPKHIRVGPIVPAEPEPLAPVAPMPDAPEPATPSPNDPEVNP